MVRVVCRAHLSMDHSCDRTNLCPGDPERWATTRSSASASLTFFAAISNKTLVDPENEHRFECPVEVSLNVTICGQSKGGSTTIVPCQPESSKYALPPSCAAGRQVK